MLIVGYDFTPMTGASNPRIFISIVSAVLGLLLASAVFYAYWPLTEGGPAPIESMIGLVQGVRGSLLNPFDIPAAEGPRWVTYYSFVLQNRIFGADAFSHYVLNVVLVAVASVAIFSFVAAVTRNLIVGFLASTLWLLNENLFNTVDWLLGRQNMLLILFGLGALALLWKRGSRFTAADAIALFALLLLASCSKEYGLAFFPAALAMAWFYRRPSFRKTAVAVAGAFVMFLLLRQFLADNHYLAEGNLACDTMGLLFAAEHYCTTYNVLDVANVKQLAWNTAGSLISLISPDIIANQFVSPIHSSGGQLRIDQMTGGDWILTVILVSALVTGIAARAPLLMVWLALILGNAILGAPFFRGRHMLAGQIGSAALIAYGFWTWAMLLTFRRQIAAATLIVILFAWASNQWLWPYAYRVNYMASGAPTKLEPAYYCNEARKTREWLSLRLPAFDPASVETVIATNNLTPCRSQKNDG